MKILALDQALVTTGYSVFEDDRLVTSGVFAVKAKENVIELRLAAIWKELDNIYEEYEPDKVIFEDIQKQSDQLTYKKLAYVQATILLWCYFRDVKYSIMAPSHWRKIISDNYHIKFGRKREEQKQVAIDFVNQKYDLEVSSDIADAICIGTAYLLETNEKEVLF
jgi:Holliday junction resolvasome RuvABC endonuclease subunit